MYYIHLYWRMNFGVFSLTDISQPKVTVSKRRCQGHRPHGDLRVEDGWDVQRPFDELRGWWPHGWASQGSCRFVGSGCFHGIRSIHETCETQSVEVVVETLSERHLNDMGMIFEPGIKYYSHRAFIKKKVSTASQSISFIFSKMSKIFAFTYFKSWWSTYYMVLIL